MFMTLPYMVITLIPQILQEASVSVTSTSLLGHSKVLSAINRAYAQMTNEGNQYERSELLDYVDMTVLNATTGLLSSSFPLYGGQFICITYPNNNNAAPNSRERTIARTVRRLGLAQARSRGCAAYGYERRGASFYVLNQGNVPLPNRVRMWFIRNMPSLHYAHPSANSVVDTEFFLNTAPINGFFDDTPNIYVSQLVHIYAGTGANQFARTSAMVGSSLTESVVASADSPNAAAWSTLPLTTSSYEILPWFPAEHYTCLAYMAAIQIRNLDGAEKAMLEYQQHREAWLNWLRTEDPSQSMPVVDGMETDAMGLMGTFGWGGYGDRLL